MSCVNLTFPDVTNNLKDLIDYDLLTDPFLNLKTHPISIIGDCFYKNKKLYSVIVESRLSLNQEEDLSQQVLKLAENSSDFQQFFIDGKPFVISLQVFNVKFKNWFDIEKGHRIPVGAKLRAYLRKVIKEESNDSAKNNKSAVVKHNFVSNVNCNGEEEHVQINDDTENNIQSRYNKSNRNRSSETTVSNFDNNCIILLSSSSLSESSASDNPGINGNIGLTKSIKKGLCEKYKQTSTFNSTSNAKNAANNANRTYSDSSTSQTKPSSFGHSRRDRHLSISTQRRSRSNHRKKEGSTRKSRNRRKSRLTCRPYEANRNCSSSSDSSDRIRSENKYTKQLSNNFRKSRRDRCSASPCKHCSGARSMSSHKKQTCNSYKKSNRHRSKENSHSSANQTSISKTENSATVDKCTKVHNCDTDCYGPHAKKYTDVKIYSAFQPRVKKNPVQVLNEVAAKWKVKLEYVPIVETLSMCNPKFQYKIIFDGEDYIGKPSWRKMLAKTEAAVVCLEALDIDEDYWY